MEINDSNSQTLQNQTSGDLNIADKERSTETDSFVNHAEIAWQQSRREWVGDQSRNSKRLSQEHIMSWTTTYEDLLLYSVPFQQPIPLTEMVDFLVDIWLEDGLYD